VAAILATTLLLADPWPPAGCLDSGEQCLGWWLAECEYYYKGIVIYGIMERCVIEYYCPDYPPYYFIEGCGWCSCTPTGPY